MAICLRNSKSSIRYICMLAMLMSLGCDSRGSRSPASPAQLPPIQDEIKELYKAIYSGDAETVWSLTHPQVIARTIATTGGVSEAKAALKESLDHGKSLSMELESLSFPASPTYLKGKSNEFVIIPTLSRIKGNGRRVESLNYQFGARPIGSNKWLYIEGSRIGRENVNELFPDFPSDFTFPRYYRKLLD